MANQKYLFVYRAPVMQGLPPAQSPEEMQESFKAWNAWREKFAKNVVDFGDGLKPTGRVLTAQATTDGPFVEAKEVLGGFSIIVAESYDHALTVAKGCPFLQVPGARIEVREMAGFAGK